MILIIGGAYQGKRSYAAENFGIAEQAWIDGAICTRKELLDAKAVYDFHKWVRRQMEDGYPVEQIAKEILEANPELLIVTDEVGYGIVPMDAKERAWREACGRVCTELAASARKVIRVCCGIGSTIKSE